jgi:hypothetical protein
MHQEFFDGLETKVEEIFVDSQSKLETAVEQLVDCVSA